MKELILDPIILMPLAAVLVIYFFVVLQVSATQGKAAYALEWLFIVSLLVLLTDSGMFPFSALKPTALSGFDKTLPSAMAQIALYAGVAVILNSWFRSFFRNITLVFRDPWIGAIVCFGLLSPFWSETPGVTLRTGLVLVMISTLAAHAGKYFNWAEMGSITRWFCFVCAVLSAFFALALPSEAVNDKGWLGILPFPIKLGTLMALSIVLWYSQASHTSKNRGIALTAIAISAINLVFTNSVQAIFALIFLLGLLFLLQFLKKLEFRQALTILVFIAANLESIFGAFGRDLTLTGRTEFWPDLVDAINQRPFTGYGLNGFWQGWRERENPAGHIVNPDGFVPPNGHNGFLDLAVELGWFSLILFSISFAGSLVRAVGHLGKYKRSEAEFPLIILVYLLLANFSETQLTGGMYYIWFLYIMISTRMRLETSKASVAYFPQAEPSVALSAARRY
jgi:exopolysaccharide production protein ExoQ